MAIVFSSKINGDSANVYTPNNYYTGERDGPFDGGFG